MSCEKKNRSIGSTLYSMIDPTFDDSDDYKNDTLSQTDTTCNNGALSFLPSFPMFDTFGPDDCTENTVRRNYSDRTRQSIQQDHPTKAASDYSFSMFDPFNESSSVIDNNDNIINEEEESTFTIISNTFENAKQSLYDSSSSSSHNNNNNNYNNNIKEEEKEEEESTFTFISNTFENAKQSLQGIIDPTYGV